MVGSEAAVQLCRDKALTAAALQKAGLGAMRTLSLAEFRRSPFYPCFLKPVSGSAGIGAGVVRDEKQFLAHTATYGENLLAQEYVPGQEFTVDVYRSRDGLVRCVVPRQRLAVRSGEVEKGVTVRDVDVIDATVKFASVLGDLWGVFCCQARRENFSGAPVRFFEVNPRFGGGSPLAIAAGARLATYVVQETLGLPVTAKMGEFTDRLLMLRYDEAVYVQAGDLSSLPGFDTPSFR
jgi:carbamoyl-phosphate synthase large subunit